MPCLLLLDSLSTPVSGSIIKVIFSFPERIVYLKENLKKKKSAIVFNVNYKISLIGKWKEKISTCVGLENKANRRWSETQKQTPRKYAF